MRTKNTLRNSIYAIASYFIIAVLALLVRKCFLQILPVEFLGYEGLFGNIFSILSLADLGIESLISYRMYSAFAAEDHKKISHLMAVYKVLYRYVGSIILLIGIAVVPVLEYIISDSSLDWTYIYIVYFIQLASTLCTYFLAYKRLMFVMDQKEYECIRVDTICALLSNLIKIFALLIFKNYIVYLFINIFNNIMANIIISIYVNKTYKYLDRAEKVSLDDVKALGIWKDIKNNIVQKVCGVIYGGTDNILISTFLGINWVGIVSNYNLIITYVTTLFTKMLNPFQISIGNLIYSEDKKFGNNLFHMFDMVSFFMACFVSISFLALFNPFIAYWVGKPYVLNYAFVVSLALNQYIQYNHKFLSFFRYSFGEYELDRNYILAAAVINIVLSLILLRYYDVAGVMMGTAIGQMGFWIGRVKMLYKNYIEEPMVQYMYRQLKRFAIFSGEAMVLLWMCDYCSVGIVGLLLRMLLCVFLPNIINFIIYFRTPEMKLLFRYVKHILNSKR